MRLFKNSTLLILFCLISTSALAESLPRDYYYVVSDVKTDSVKEGRCIVRGRVTEAWSEQGVGGGMIANFNKTVYTVTDDSGYYQMELGSNDTAIFFFHAQYSEIVCWSYEFKSQHVVTMNFVTSEKLPDGLQIIEEKPVIYLYPTKETSVSITLDSKINMTSSYPLYNNGWEVVATPDGLLQSNGRKYPYLFWEGEMEEYNFEVDYSGMHAIAINTDSTVQFLEHQLSNFGFNTKESTDFITYWAPRIQSHPFAVIQFLVDEEYDAAIGDLTISPKPDVMRRVYLFFRGAEQYPVSCTNELPNKLPLKREGFVVIEWGGSELSSSKKL